MRNKSVERVLVLLAACSVCGCTGYSGTPHGVVAVETGNAHVALVFSDSDRAEIHRYYRQHLPPGLAKRETLPPGLRKQLVKRGSLPPGLGGERLPADLERRLGRLPAGYARLRIATDVVLLDENTHIILDVITDIGR